ncbi:hypothetical protein L596_008136 [Steinernema carpocapsae]|uniref:Uncharacterized protein n=1 Tax=Steinernema carpocapsae TaxID=34508 RepID=A0A4U5PBM2_STECR|nr:hypothetical protein L596_008136 [Steinernema carpocapsae]
MFPKNIRGIFFRSVFQQQIVFFRLLITLVPAFLFFLIAHFLFSHPLEPQNPVAVCPIFVILQSTFRLHLYSPFSVTLPLFRSSFGIVAALLNRFPKLNPRQSRRRGRGPRLGPPLYLGSLDSPRSLGLPPLLRPPRSSAASYPASPTAANVIFPQACSFAIAPIALYGRTPAHALPPSARKLFDQAARRLRGANDPPEPRTTRPSPCHRPRTGAADRNVSLLEFPSLARPPPRTSRVGFLGRAPNHATYATPHFSDA